MKILTQFDFVVIVFIKIMTSVKCPIGMLVISYFPPPISTFLEERYSSGGFKAFLVKTHLTCIILIIYVLMVYFLTSLYSL